jgi:transcription termination factor Rho
MSSDKKESVRRRKRRAGRKRSEGEKATEKNGNRAQSEGQGGQGRSLSQRKKGLNAFRPRHKRGGGKAGKEGGSGRSRNGGRRNGQRANRSRNREEQLRRLFTELQRGTSIDPHERFRLEREDGAFTPRVLDLVAPVGKGQRCLIVAPPKAGKTTLLHEICRSLEVNHPEVKVFALLVDERPEEVTDFRRATHAEVIASSSDRIADEHVKVVEDAIQVVLEPVLRGEDVVLMLDSITRLARAYNTVKGDSGRTLTGGLDANAMQIPRRLFGAARCIEDGGSLTILGTALVETGSRMDEVIFQEFKGTGNSEIVLSRQLFEKRIFPAVDIGRSGTRKEEKLHPPDYLEHIRRMRRVLSDMPPDRAMDGLLKLMAKCPTNKELLDALPTAPAAR